MFKGHPKGLIAAEHGRAFRLLHYECCIGIVSLL